MGSYEYFIKVKSNVKKICSLQKDKNRDTDKLITTYILDITMAMLQAKGKKPVKFVTIYPTLIHFISRSKHKIERQNIIREHSLVK